MVPLIREYTIQQQLIASPTLFFEYVFHVAQAFSFIFIPQTHVAQAFCLRFLIEDSFQCKTCLIVESGIFSSGVNFSL